MTFAGPLSASLIAVLTLVGATGCLAGTTANASPDRVTPAAVDAPPSTSPGARNAAVTSAAGEGLPLLARPGAPPDAWTWIDFPDSRCANGSPTGIAVNLRPQSRHLMVFLEGGGACDNGQDCWVQPTAVNIASGYGVEQFGDDPAVGLPLFDRGDAGNPFSDASYVFVPYCTGDLHAGDAVAAYDVNGQQITTYHYGAHNLDLYLAQLGASLSPDHVWLVGQSAGGFGTLFNQGAVARAFGARTDVIDDSGPGIGVSGYPASWNVRLPPRCRDCGDGLAALFLYGRETYPASRFGFLSFQIDVMLPGFYGASEQDVVEWLGLYEGSFASLANTRSFVAPGTGHVVIGGAIDSETKAAAFLWLTQMVGDDPAWGE